MTKEEMENRLQELNNKINKVVPKRISNELEQLKVNTTLIELTAEKQLLERKIKVEELSNE